VRHFYFAFDELFSIRRNRLARASVRRGKTKSGECSLIRRERFHAVLALADHIHFLNAFQQGKRVRRGAGFSSSTMMVLMGIGAAN